MQARGKKSFFTCCSRLGTVAARGNFTAWLWPQLLPLTFRAKSDRRRRSNGKWMWQHFNDYSRDDDVYGLMIWSDKTDIYDELFISIRKGGQSIATIVANLANATLGDHDDVRSLTPFALYYTTMPMENDLRPFRVWNSMDMVVLGQECHDDVQCSSASFSSRARGHFGRGTIQQHKFLIPNQSLSQPRRESVICRTLLGALRLHCRIPSSSGHVKRFCT